MSEPEVVYGDQAIVLRRGNDERGWFFVEETYYPLPRYMNHVRYRISLSPTAKTCTLLKVWQGWAMGEGGLAGSASTRISLDEAEGAELRRRLHSVKTPDEFEEIWSDLWRR
jgi:hypothetical protein